VARCAPAMHGPHKLTRPPPVKVVGAGLQTHKGFTFSVLPDAMSEHDSNSQPQSSQDAPDDGTPRRPARSGEGLDSVITRLREQEDQRAQNDPTIGISRNAH